MKDGGKKIWKKNQKKINIDLHTPDAMYQILSLLNIEGQLLASLKVSQIVFISVKENSSFFGSKANDWLTNSFFE